MKAVFRKRPATSTEAINWSDCLLILEVPTYSESLHFRAYAEHLGAGSVLQWVIRRLRRATAEISEVYVLVNRREENRVRNSLEDQPGASLWPCSGSAQLHELRQLARTTKKTRLLVVDLTAALLPSTAFEVLLHDHANNRNHITILVGSPCSASPVLTETVFITTLADSIPGLPQDLRAAVAGLERALRSEEETRLVRIDRVRALATDDQDLRKWPFKVQLRTQDDVAILRSVLQRCAPDIEDSKGEPLDSWAEVLCEYYQTSLGDRRRCNVGDTNRTSAGSNSHHRPRRVLYVQSPSAFTGVEQVLVLVAAGIGRDLAAGFECSALISLPGTLTDRLTQAGVDVHLANRDFARSSVSEYLFSRRKLDEIAPGLVHAHTVVGAPFCSAVADRDVPFVQHVHVASEHALAQLVDQMSFASAVIAVSNFVGRRVMRLGIDPRKIHVIHNGTRINTSSTGDGEMRVRMRKALGLSDAAQLLLVVARFAGNKRHDIALDAFARLRLRLPHAYLILAGEAFPGDEPVLNAVHRRIERLRLRAHVRLLGFWRDMPALYAAADVLLLPSENEPFGMVVLEAMASGVPVVAARSGGIPEIIEQAKSGLLIEPGDVQGFATALEQVLNDAELRRKLIDGGLARWQAEFSISHFVRRVGNLYERLLAGEVVVAGDI